MICKHSGLLEQGRRRYLGQACLSAHLHGFPHDFNVYMRERLKRDQESGLGALGNSLNLIYHLRVKCEHLWVKFSSEFHNFDTQGFPKIVIHGKNHCLGALIHSADLNTLPPPHSQPPHCS